MATPFASTGAVPSDVAPSKNSTDPPVPTGDTVAVRVILVPNLAGLLSEASVTEVGIAFTCNVAGPLSRSV
jgi:hypothetical protein